MSFEIDIAAPAKPVKRKKSQSRFQKLWDEAERIKQQNLKLEDSLDEVVQRMRVDLGPIELEMGRSMREQMDKLIVFAGRKSLSFWQRDVLDSWIVSNMEILGDMGLIDASLRDSLATLQAQALGIEIESDTDLSAADQLLHAIEEISRLEEEQQEVDDDFDESFEQEQDYEAWFKEQLSLFDLDAEDEQHQTHSGSDDNFGDNSKKSAEPNPQELFKTLFHRVARVLHPDKEADPIERENKQALMSQLLEARRQHDLIKVITLYRKHVDASLDFGDDEHKALENVLIRFIEQESRRMEEITEQSEMHFIAFSQFYHPEPKQVEKKFKQKISEIEGRRKEIETFTNNVTSLQKLKPYLEARYDAMVRFFY